MHILSNAIRQANLGGFGGSDPTTSGGGSGTPVWTEDFESGTLNTNITSIAGISDSTVKFSTDYVISGTQSAKSTINASAGGTGFWGHYFTFANASPALPNLGDGDEIWSQWKVYYPALFNFDAGGSLKLYRHYISGTDANAYIDLYMNSSVEPALFSWREEIWNGINIPPGRDPGINFNAQNDRTDLNNSTTVTRGTVHKFEVYVKLGTPGNGIVRVWLDDVLLFEDSLNGTIANTDNVMTRVHMWSYWNTNGPTVDSNGDPISSQDAYYDDLIIFTNNGGAPPNTDSEGNAFIGSYSI